MNPILLRYVGFALAAVIAGAGGGYLAVNNKIVSPPSVTRSGTIPAVPARPFPGLGIRAIPASPAIPAIPRVSSNVCPKIPELAQLSSLDPSWNVDNLGETAKSYWITTMLKSKNGALYVAGFKYGLINYYDDGVIGDGYIPFIYKSTNNGVSWTAISLPPTTKAWAMIYAMAEDDNGTLYAAGTKIWKSTDGGNTWVVLPMPYPGFFFGGPVPETYTISAKNNSIIVAFGDNAFTNPYPYRYFEPTVFRSTDGGNTWTKLFSHPVPISSIVEANDGSIIFREYASPGGVYRYADRIVTQTFLGGPASIEYDAGLLKARDGSIYFVTADPSTDVMNVYGPKYDQPGGAYLVTYKSSDNGKTWTKLGSLPNSWTIQGSIIEAPDGAMYVNSYAICYESNSVIYKSADQGISWKEVGHAPKFWQKKADSYYPGYFINAMVESGGKVLSGGNNAPWIFTTK